MFCLFRLQELYNTTYGLHSFSYRGFKNTELSSGSCFRTSDFTEFFTVFHSFPAQFY